MKSRLLLLAAVLLWIAMVVQPRARGTDGDRAPPVSSGTLSPALAGGRIVSGATEHRLVHFTFDDGPDPRETPRVLELLDELGVKATFFFSATRFVPSRKGAERSRQIALDVLRRGHTIGSHSFLHRRMYKFSPEELRAQLDRAEQMFRRVFGAKPALFRPPFGARSRAVDRELAERGYTTVLWNLGLADWVRRPPEEILKTWRKVLRRREREQGHRGGIVLLHDTHPWSVDAVPLLVRELHARNCQLLKQGQELYEILDDPSPFIIPRDGDSHAMAPLLRLDPGELASRQKAVREREQARCGSVSDAL